MTPRPPWEPLVRPNAPGPYEPGALFAFEFRCPGCGRWGDIDGDQYEGRVSIDHTTYGDGSPTGCAFHRIIDCRQINHLAYGESEPILAPVVVSDSNTETGETER